MAKMISCEFLKVVVRLLGKAQAQVHQDNVLAAAWKRIQRRADNHSDASDKLVRKYGKRAKQRHDERKADALQGCFLRVVEWRKAQSNAR